MQAYSGGFAVGNRKDADFEIERLDEKDAGNLF